MSSPKVTNWSWQRSIPQFAVMAILMIVAYRIVPNITASRAMAIGAIAYLAYSLISRSILARHHRLGIRAFREGHFGAAIGHYDQSIEFFERYPWIDRFRAVTMMSPSAWSYREMGMLNKAFAESQNDNHESAITGYEAVLKDYPDNEMALQALKMLKTPNREGKQDVRGNADPRST